LVKDASWVVQPCRIYYFFDLFKDDIFAAGVITNSEKDKEEKRSMKLVSVQTIKVVLSFNTGGKK
jgi:hypothetical protein